MFGGFLVLYIKYCNEGCTFLSNKICVSKGLDKNFMGYACLKITSCCHAYRVILLWLTILAFHGIGVITTEM